MCKTYVAVGVGALIIMPLQRLASYASACITYLIPGGLEGAPHGWYSVGWYRTDPTRARPARCSSASSPCAE